MSDKKHWDSIYTTKGSKGVSWYQDTPEISLRLIRAAGLTGATVIDVGGGASPLVDYLIKEPAQGISVLDLSGGHWRRPGTVSEKLRLASHGSKVISPRSL